MSRPEEMTIPKKCQCGQIGQLVLSNYDSLKGGYTKKMLYCKKCNPKPKPIVIERADELNTIVRGVNIKVTLEREGAYIVLTGRTYPFKDSIKMCHFRWNPTTKEWWKKVTEKTLFDEIDAIKGAISEG